jgi:hypothetical protein
MDTHLKRANRQGTSLFMNKRAILVTLLVYFIAGAIAYAQKASDADTTAQPRVVQRKPVDPEARAAALCSAMFPVEFASTIQIQKFAPPSLAGVTDGMVREEINRPAFVTGTVDGDEIIPVNWTLVVPLELDLRDENNHTNAFFFRSKSVVAFRTLDLSEQSPGWMHLAYDFTVRLPALHLTIDDQSYADIAMVLTYHVPVGLNVATLTSARIEHVRKVSGHIPLTVVPQ